jgi:hypothetical protein
MTDAVSVGTPAMPSAHDRRFVAYTLGSVPKFERCLPDILVQEAAIPTVPMTLVA